MNSIVKETLDKLRQCDDFHNRCDYLLEHSEITYLLEYIELKENIIKEVREIFKDYGEKEDIVGYTMYNITGEMLLKLLEILDKVDKENNNEGN